MEAPVTYLLPSSIIKGESEGVSDGMMTKRHPISIWYVGKGKGKGVREERVMSPLESFNRGDYVDGIQV
jgi:hypothetical protein